MRFFIILFSFFLLQQQRNHNKNTINEVILIGKKAYLNKNLISLKNSYKELYRLYKYSKDSSLLAKHYHYKALSYKIQYINDSSYYFYHKSQKISELLKDSLSVGRRLLSIAVLQRQAKDFLGSEISSIEALHFLEPINSFTYLESIYNNLGLINEELKQKKEALKYYKKAFDIINLSKDKNRKKLGHLRTVNNLGLLYQKEKQYIKAISYFEKGLSQDSLKEKHPIQYALLLENLAYSNYSFGKKETILQQYYEVFSIRKKHKENHELSTTHINISNYYKDLNQTKKALYHSNEALKYAKQTHNNKRWLEALKNLSELTAGKQSKKYLQEYIALNDSLFQKERQLKNQFAKIRYETDKKEKENTVLKSENEKKQTEIVYQKQQKAIGWLLAAASLLALGLSVSFFILRRRKLLYQAQLERVQAREHERQQIAKSLHDEVAGDLRLLHQKLEKSNLLEEAQKLDTVKENVRNLSHQLSSVSFNKVSFKDQIINLVSDYFELDFRITVTGLQENEWQTINDAIKRLLYLSIRESIQNCKKHAKASTIKINLDVQKKYVFLNITDNGIGFDTAISKKGIGLQNLQERIEELNGTLNITSKTGNGTKTDIQIPLNV